MATIVATKTQSLSDATSRPYIDISNTDFLSIQIDGTFVATWVLQVSLDAVNWYSFAMHQTAQSDATVDATSGTITGFFSKPCSGMKYFRCVLTAYTSGTVNCIINETILRK